MAPPKPEPLAQLALFEGPHVPRRAAREALLRGDFAAARARLAGLADAPEEAADADRLEQIAGALQGASEAGGDLVASVHAAFAAGVAPGGPDGFLSDADWLSAYARRLAETLAEAPGRRFRGWLGAHFAFALASADRGGKEADAARRAAEQLVRAEPPGPAWIEAARLAFALGEPVRAQSWLHAACLESPTELAPEPSALEPCDVPALDAAPPLPSLPAPVEDTFDVARALETASGPWWCWVAVVGEIDRVLVPATEAMQGDAPVGDASADGGFAGAEDAEPDPTGEGAEPNTSGAGAEPDTSGAGAPPDPGGDPPRAFLAALRAARRSRERDRAQSPERCSDRELRARRRMQRIAPILLERYLRSLRGALF